MVMRIGGLASGMDIDALVEKLMTAERSPLNKLQQKKQTYEWQRDAYRSVNTKLKTFDTYISDNLILKNFNSRTATSSNPAFVSATATGSATGTVTIEGVSQLAKSARGIGEQISANGTTKLTDLLGATALPSEIKLSSIKSNGTMSSDVSIQLDSNMTVSQFVTKLNSSNAGVSAIFESGKLSITAKNTGDNKSGAEIKVNAGGEVFKALGFTSITGSSGDLATNGTNAVFQVNGIATERSTNNFSINGYNITLNSTFNADKTTAERYNTALLEWKNTHSTEYSTALTDAETRKNNAETALQTKQAEQVTARTNLIGSLTPTDINNFNKIGVNLAEKALAANLYNAMPSYADVTTYNDRLANATDLTVQEQFLKDNNVTYDQFKAMEALGESNLQFGLNSATYNTLGESFFNGLTDQEKSLLTAAQATIGTKDLNTQITDWSNSTNSDPDLAAAEKALATKLSSLSDTQKDALTRILKDTEGLTPYVSLATANKDVATSQAEKNAATTEYNNLVNRKQTAEDNFASAYKVQTGQDLTGAVDVNALSDVTVPTNSSNAITLSSTSNIDDMVNKVKEFVTTYNGLIKDLSDQTKQSKYRDYQPLTAEQRKEMDEDEIKLWEEKAKSGLLRNDSLIRDGLSNMRSLVYQSNPAIEDTRYNTLFNIGITTSRSFNDGGTLEIDEAKLRKALEENPDAVEQLLKNSTGKKDAVVNGETVDTRGYLAKLRDSMKTLEINIEKKAGRSTMTDAQYAIGKSLMDNATRISSWERKLEDIEARYWKQFTAMETAINKANQQSSMFMQGQ